MKGRQRLHPCLCEAVDCKHLDLFSLLMAELVIKKNSEDFRPKFPFDMPTGSRRVSGAGFDSMSPMSQELLQSLKASSSQRPEKSKILTENFLGHLVKLWASGNLTNFDYIMLLNYLCGRTFSNPNHYPVLPWVSSLAGYFLPLWNFSPINSVAIQFSRTRSSEVVPMP